MIKNSKRFTIKGSTFNNVRGDQTNNNTTFNVDTLHYNGEIATKRTEYDEFDYVKRGHVITLKEICSRDVFENEWGNHPRDRKTRAKVFSIELFGQESKFTAVEYEGEEAQDIWEEDFRKFSRDRSPDSWLLYGLNHSEVPMLIFHHDLIPLAHFCKKSLWMSVYFSWLTNQMGCFGSEIWMDTSRGVFCAGPLGPDPNMLWGPNFVNSIIVPSTRDMLNANIIFRFFRQFSSKEFHNNLLFIASFFRKSHFCYSLLFPAIGPEILEEEQRDLQSFFPGLPYEQLRSSLLGLQFGNIYSTSLDAVARWQQGAIQWRWDPYGLVDQTSVGELTRFMLCGDEPRVVADLDSFHRSKCWLSQFPRCVEEGKTEDYFFIDADLWLDSYSPREYDGLACFFKLCDGEIPPPIYLFLYPITAMTISEVISWSEGRTHFWSLDENGQSEMTEDELEKWGVPRLAMLTPKIGLSSWDSSIYTTLYDWQVAHGFDPNTAEFARYLDLPELEILRPKEEKSSSWWEAVPGISAFGF